MASLPPDLQNRLRRELTTCDAFSDDRALQAVFMDSRLEQWRGRVPNAYNPASRFNFLMSALLDAWNTNGDNALYLFVCVLSEQTQRRDLAELAQDVRHALISQKITDCERELSQLEENAKRGWSDPVYTTKRRSQLQVDTEKWRTLLATTPPLCYDEAKVSPKRKDDRLQESGIVDEVYTDLEIYISPRDAVQGSYTTIARVDGGPQYRDEQQWGQDTRKMLAAASDSDQYGQILFGKLFTREIYGAYIAARHNAKAHEDRLRLRLWIDHDAADLHALAWERLHYPQEGGTFRVTTNAKLPFSRYYGLQRETSPSIAGQARMLCVISNPRDLDTSGYTPLDVEAETANLCHALDGLRRAGMHVTLLPGHAGISRALQNRLKVEGYAIEPGPATLDHVMQLLAYAPGFHILHFVGHGAFSERNNHAMLVLEDADGDADKVSDDDLINRLNGLERKPHLIFLAACESARRDAGDARRADEDTTPFVGLAPRLIQIGINAVIAMQDRMPVQAAQTLTQHFYPFVLQHGIVDKALNQARNFLGSQSGWDMPVLFMHLKKGRLFERDALVPVDVPAEPASNVDTTDAGPAGHPAGAFPPNPFFEVQVIRDGNRFVGREDDLRRLRTMLQGGSVTLLGEPKVGKSSLMWRLAQSWQAENGGHVIGPLDCHGIFHCQDFYEQLSEALGIPLTDDVRKLRGILRRTEGLLLLDEMDYAPRWGLHAEDLALFRAVCSANPGFKLVAVSRVPLKEIFPDNGRGSPAYNFLLPFTLGPLTGDDARALLAHPWAPDAPAFDATTVSDLLALAGTHPFKLQRAAHHRYEALRSPGYDWKAAYEQEIRQML